MGRLDKIREKLKNMDTRGGGKGMIDNAVYPFWKMNEDDLAVIRFLPDGDDDNTFFWVEREQIRIPFPGVKGQDENKPVTVVVPCIEMWGERCPIHNELRAWFKDPSLEDEARKYWKKRSYIFQGFVRQDPLNEEEPPENPIRRFMIGPQIYNIIKNALMDGDIEEDPVDYENGTDFKLKKGMKGKYADYSASSWARKESALTEEELEAIDTHGLSNLSEFLPKKPTEEQLEAIVEMFYASVEGDLYDPEKWGQFYRPRGVDIGNNSSGSNNTDRKERSSNKEEAQEKVAEPKPSRESATADNDDDNGGESNNAKAILDKIKQRRSS